VASATDPLPVDNLVHYALDPRKGSFTVQAFATGLLSAFGHSPRFAIRNFDGKAQFALARYVDKRCEPKGDNSSRVPGGAR
jgi:hypothetical protein